MPAATEIIESRESIRICAIDNDSNDIQLAEVEGDRSARCNPQALAVISIYQSSTISSGDQNGLTWSYSQLDEASHRLALSLLNNGVRQGMRAIVFLYNSIEWALWFWTCVKLGVTFVPLDPKSISREAELRHYLCVISPDALVVTDEADAEALQKCLDADVAHRSLKVVASGADLKKDLIPGWISYDRLLSGTNCCKIYDRYDMQMGSDDIESDVILILFTSGTTGLPKACPYTSRTMWEACMVRHEARAMNQTSRLAHHLPPWHVFAMIDQVMTWGAGACVIYPTSSFDAAATLQAIETQMYSFFSLVHAMLNHPDFEPSKLKSLCAITLGGTVTSPEVVEAFSKLGIKVVVGYGMTEGVPAFCSIVDGTAMVRRGSIGLPRPTAGVRVKICEPGSRKILKRGEVGELHFGGDILIKGYMNENNTPFYSDERGRWINSGDQAEMTHEGACHILGRYKDIIIRGGENLSPAMIENCLNKAGVISQVVGVPDEVADEVPLAVIRPRKPGPLPIEAMQALVTKEMGTSCVPSAYLSLEDLGIENFPLANSGKVRKHELRVIVLKYLEAQKQIEGKETRQKPSPASEQVTSTEKSLFGILSKALGQPQESLALDKTIQFMADSIKVLRLQASIKRALRKDVSTKEIYEAATIQELARRLDDRMAVSEGPQQKDGLRKGPPLTQDMVHAEGDETRALRTKESVSLALAPLGILWDEVEDVFPMIAVCAYFFSQTRFQSGTVRVSLTTRGTSLPKLRASLQSVLEQWGILRSIAVKVDKIPLHVIIRAGTAWFDNVVTEVPDIETPDDLRSHTPAVTEKFNVLPRNGGPLARFFIANVKSIGSAGLVILLHHSLFDAMSLTYLLEDLEHKLQGAEIEHHAPYKLFADIYYQHRQSLLAQQGVVFHTTRLAGLASARDAVWPPQRCQGWHIGDDAGWQPPPGVRMGRTQVDGDAGRAGMIGIERVFSLPELSTLVSTYHISESTVFKAACALVNIHQTGHSEALFINSQSGRSWPFISPALAAYLPHPATIGGCTIASPLDRIRVAAHQTVGALLTTIEADQRLLTLHAHAPLAEIRQRLLPEDVQVFEQAIRQVFNFVPHAPQMAASEEGLISLIDMEGSIDVMLIWYGSMLNRQTGRVIAQWDGCQVGKAEVEGWVEQMVRAVCWLSQPGHWECEVRALEFL